MLCVREEGGARAGESTVQRASEGSVAGWVGWRYCFSSE
jgi:hypothetical protein